MTMVQDCRPYEETRCRQARRGPARPATPAELDCGPVARRLARRETNARRSRSAGRLARRAAYAVLWIPLSLVLLPLLPCVLLMHAVKKLHDWQQGPREAGRSPAADPGRRNPASGNCADGPLRTASRAAAASTLLWAWTVPHA